MKGKKVIHINEEELKKIVELSVSKVLNENYSNETMDFNELFHFDSISDEELLSQYVDLSSIVSTTGYGGKFMGVNGKILKEEATTTLSVEETKKQIQNKFQLKDWQFSTQIVANNVRLVLLYPSIFKNTRLIKDAMLACGWTLAVKGRMIRGKMIWNVMSFDPMFQENLNHTN